MNKQIEQLLLTCLQARGANADMVELDVEKVVAVCEEALIRPAIEAPKLKSGVLWDMKSPVYYVDQQNSVSATDSFTYDRDDGWYYTDEWYVCGDTDYLTVRPSHCFLTREEAEHAASRKQKAAERRKERKKRAQKREAEKREAERERRRIEMAF